MRKITEEIKFYKEQLFSNNYTKNKNILHL